MDFSHNEKEGTAFKAEQIHKMKTIFTQNGPRVTVAGFITACMLIKI
jgi:hypothetical protein